ncbi:TrkH family potassium uptake protein [uncultured Clostridium sp.]|uniref:TrkH family potassium uptake protein n=1 Tax=uncultured Clostridium sp. TaxID=59620 RepID=UPI0026F30316|nr:potassium transporter TrkG [uncultured Clostridium sp.]
MLRNKKSYLIPIVGFATIILISAIILYLPICNLTQLNFRNILYITTSAITTCGLSKGSVVQQFSFLGQVVIAILMEIGALGFIIFFSYFWSIRNKKIKMSDMLVINDNISGDNYSLIKEHSIFIGKFMIKVQIIGAILLSLRFIPKFGIFQGIWHSIFMTISSFSNGGFDLFGGNSLANFSNDVYTQIIITMLMFIGAIGIFTIEDIKNNKLRKFSRLKLQTKITLIGSAIIIILPAILINLYEKDISFLNSLFLTVSSRSTGFTITDLSKFNFGSKVILIVLMMIGGSPTSTAGGIKIITLTIIIFTIISTLRGKSETIILWKKIPTLVVRKAFTICILFVTLLLVSCLLFGHFNNIGAINIVFESASALSNTGLTITDYNQLNPIGDYILISLMFIGRVGPLSMVLLFVNEDKTDKFLKYPEENIVL